MFGVAPPGKGCLTALIWVFVWVPLILLIWMMLSQGGH
jgi:hypothetical protein